MPHPNQFNKISKILSAVSRSSFFFAATHFNAVPSKLLSIAVHACLSSFKLSFSNAVPSKLLSIAVHACLSSFKLSFSGTDQSIHRPFAFSFQTASSLDDPSCLTRINSTKSRRFYPQCRVPLPSSQPRISTSCLLSC